MADKLDQIIVIDVEATCWEGHPPANEESEIIEIGLCVMDVQRGERIGRERIVVKPSRSRVSPFCTQLTGLTQAEVETGRSFGDACRYLGQHYHTRQRTWASYGDYDRRQFERQCQRDTVPYPFGPTHLNVKNLCALRYPLEHEVSLAKALEHCGRRFDGTPHRGVDDAWNIAGLLILLLHGEKNG